MRSFLTVNVLFCLIPETQCFAYDGQVEMLVCSCNFITEKDIVDVINGLLDEDCWQLIVPAKVYHAMQKRGRCCGCFPNVVDIIIRTTEQYHARGDSTDAEIFDFMTRLKQFHEENRRADLERRHKGHRAA
ncbi:(2Fe-2S)-binding protein [Shinella sumterensis]|uniref:(2Fe-2S)-binding protein n=3 Tax=Rhizobiaceae TaxID=82115 RepID=A0AA50H7S5_9HYPH|nr:MULTISPECIES: (2Fe-2S)-binding protein [Shinella]WLR97114.1 (2Fe-2S)-binding protein [Shinella sumterensis]WLS03743.1 (2Fe-2S)-binding protein [Shinella oryzae]